MDEITLTQILINLGVNEVRYFESESMYLVDIDWLIWTYAEGSPTDKYSQLDSELESLLPPGSEWDTV